MKQCILKNGNRNFTVWIPVKYAVVGKCLRLREDDGWIVQSVGAYLDFVVGQRGYFAGGIGR